MDPDRSSPAPSDPLGRALAVVGDRWSLAVVDALLDAPRRFGELSDAVGGIAPNILTRRLAHLERAGLVVATPYSRRPVRLSYALTEPGIELAAVIAQLRSWGARTGVDDTGRHHDACGAALESRPWCPTCERVVGDDESSELAWA